MWAELPRRQTVPGDQGQQNCVILPLPLHSLLKIVSSSGFVTDEGWIVLSRVDARMPRSRQTSVGRVKSISLQFRVPQSSWLQEQNEQINK